MLASGDHQWKILLYQSEAEIDNSPMCIICENQSHWYGYFVITGQRNPFSDHPTPPSQKEMGYLNLNQTIVISLF